MNMAATPTATPAATCKATGQAPGGAAAREPLLRVEALSVGLRRPEGDSAILSAVDFTLDRGEIVGVIGESGSGKTVLARALVNWLAPPLEVLSGRVLFGGRDLAHLSRREAAAIRGRRVGYIGANPTSSLDPTLPVGDQLVEKLRAVEPGIGRRAARGRVLDLLAAVHIPTPRERFNEYPFQFSGGMMQRAMIVDALVSRPDFLVCDNITQPLDVTVAAQILRLVRELRDEFRTGIVFVSSSLPVAREVADDILVLSGGRVVEHRPPAALIDAPEHAYTRELLDRLPRIWSVQDPPRGRMGEGAPVLSVRGVSKTYTTRKRGSFAGMNHVRAVRDVSFDVFAGENFGIVGESGCGKSTLTRLLSWLETPDSGAIAFEGQDLKGLGRQELVRLRNRFQLLLQDPYNSLPPRMTIGRMIAEPLLIHGQRQGPALRERVEATMQEVGLAPRLYGELPLGLSAGQRQRIAIARALVLEPRLMILDETLSALDQSEQGRLLDLFAKLQDEHRLTYIYISPRPRDGAADLQPRRRHVPGRGGRAGRQPHALLRARPSLHPRAAERRADPGDAALRQRRRAAGGRAAEPDRPAARLCLPLALPPGLRPLRCREPAADRPAGAWPGRLLPG